MTDHMLSAAAGAAPSAPKGPFGLPIDKALNWANTINVLALILVAIAGAVVAVCTLLILRWQAQQDQYKDAIFDHYKAGVAGEVADASRQGLEAGKAASDAKAAAANAQVEIAKANERAAKFEKEAAEARERTAALDARTTKTETFAEGLAVQQQGIAKKVQAAPTLSPEQIEALGEALKPFSGSKFSVHTMTDAGAQRLGGQIQAAMKIAGIQDAGSSIDLGQNYSGVLVAVHNAPGEPPLADALIAALRAHGINAQGVLAPDRVAVDVVSVLIGPA